MPQTDRFLLAGVMGWPIAHSRSPQLHNYWYAKYGLHGTYVPLAVRPENLRVALRALPALGFVGTNLTIPLKEAALGIVDRADPLARRVGAVNCVIVMPDGTLAGENHDGFGFIESVLEAQPAWRADTGPVVVIGAGGSSRAILVALMDRGAREIRLINRTPERAQAIEREFGGAIRRCRGRIAMPRSRVPPPSSTPPARAWPASRRWNWRSIVCPRTHWSSTWSTSRVRRRC